MNLSIPRVSERALPGAMAALAGSAAAAMVLLAPAWGLERLVGESGLAAVLSSAEPPLGGTARALIALIAAFAVASGVFVGLRWLEGMPRIRPPRFAKFARNESDVVRAPEVDTAAVQRGPIFAARDLGAPFNSVVAQTRPGRSEPIAAAEPDSEDQHESPSIAELVARLEAGMQRRRANAGAVRGTSARPGVTDMDSALRDALGTLERMQARARG